MFGWAVSLFLLSLSAGHLGFYALIGMAAVAAKLLLLMFLALLVFRALSSALDGQPPENIGAAGKFKKRIPGRNESLG